MFYFREAISGLRSFAHAQTEWKAVCEKLAERLANYFGVQEVGADAFILEYQIAGHWLKVRRGDGTGPIKFEADEFFAESYRELLAITGSPVAAAETAEDTVRADTAMLLKKRFAEILVPELGSAATYEQLFVPAARASLALMPTQMLGQIAGRQDLDVWMPKFAELLSGTRNTLRGTSGNLIHL